MCTNVSEVSRFRKSKAVKHGKKRENGSIKGSIEGGALDTFRLTLVNDPDSFSYLTSQTLDKGALIKRARRKYLSDALIPLLALAADLMADKKQAKAYWHTWHCTGSITEYEDGRISAWYCKRRWCPICNAIRTAQVIERLTPVFEQWGEAYFVTLTQGSTVDGEALKCTIDTMQANFTKCKYRAQNRSKRAGAAKFVGIRKLEVTYNGRDNKYHPHYHVLVNDENVARNLVADWLQLNPLASPNAQHVAPANKNSLAELAKYMTKITATDSKGNRRIYADGLHTMFSALNGVRTMQTFGFKLPPEKECEPEASAPASNNVVSVSQWLKDIADWVNHDTGELLSGYIPSDAMKQVVESICMSHHYE